MKRFLAVLVCLILLAGSAVADVIPLDDCWMSNLMIGSLTTAKDSEKGTAYECWMWHEEIKDEDLKMKSYAQSIMGAAYDIACEYRTFKFSYDKKDTQAFIGLMKGEDNAIMLAFRMSSGKYTIGFYDFEAQWLCYDSKTKVTEKQAKAMFEEYCEEYYKMKGKTLSDGIWQVRNIAKTSLKKRPVNEWTLFE